MTNDRWEIVEFARLMNARSSMGTHQCPMDVWNIVLPEDEDRPYVDMEQVVHTLFSLAMQLENEYESDAFMHALDYALQTDKARIDALIEVAE